MVTMTLDTPYTGEAPQHEDRRVSPEPADGYVLNPWSGLYQETEATYQHRLNAAEALTD